MAEKNGIRLVSLNPENAIQGGLALNDVTVEITESRFAMWDYNGTRQEATPALHWKMRDVENGAEYDQYWSAGSETSGFVLVDGGKNLGAPGKQSGMVKDCKAMILLASLFTSGLPADFLAGDDISTLEGAVVHIIQVPDKERKGLKDQKEGRTTPVVDKVVTLPGEKKAGKGKAKSTPAPTTASAAPEDDGELVGVVVATIMGLLEKNGPTARVALGAQVFTELSGNPLKQKAVMAVHKPQWLEGLGMFKIEAGVVSIP
jgi:hypothetical protein